MAHNKTYLDNFCEKFEGNLPEDIFYNSRDLYHRVAAQLLWYGQNQQVDFVSGAIPFTNEELCLMNESARLDLDYLKSSGFNIIPQLYVVDMQCQFGGLSLPDTYCIPASYSQNDLITLADFISRFMSINEIRDRTLSTTPIIFVAQEHSMKTDLKRYNQQSRHPVFGSLTEINESGNIVWKITPEGTIEALINPLLFFNLIGNKNILRGVITKSLYHNYYSVMKKYLKDVFEPKGFVTNRIRIRTLNHATNTYYDGRLVKKPGPGFSAGNLNIVNQDTFSIVILTGCDIGVCVKDIADIMSQNYTVPFIKDGKLNKTVPTIILVVDCIFTNPLRHQDAKETLGTLQETYANVILMDSESVFNWFTRNPIDDIRLTKHPLERLRNLEKGHVLNGVT